jgi:hypothetical protein
MDLVEKFKMASSCQTVKVSSLIKDKPYLIEHVILHLTEHLIEHIEKVQTRYGEAVLLTLKGIPAILCEGIFTATL